MATLKNINVVHGTGKVVVSMTFEDAPDAHFPLPLKVARQLHEKLGRACEFASAGGSAPGDTIGVSEAIGMKILPPKGH